MTTVSDGYRPRGFAGAGSDLLDLLHHVQPLNDLSEHHVLAVEPLRLRCADEELRSVGSRTGVGHGQNAGAGVLLHEVLVCELGAVDRLASSAVSGGEVAALAHEVRDHTVEDRALVVERLAAPTDSLLASAEGAEVLGGAGSGVGEELEHDPTGGLAADGHVEEDSRVWHSCSDGK